MVVCLILIAISFYFAYRDDMDDDNMSDEGWNEKYNR